MFQKKLLTFHEKNISQNNYSVQHHEISLHVNITDEKDTGNTKE